MNSFSFSPIPELVFGAGKLSVLPLLLEKYGKNVLIVTGKGSFINSPQAAVLFGNLTNKGFKWSVYQVAHEPSPDDVDRAVEQFRSNPPDVVLTIGGGSVVDSGKAISAMLTAPETIIHYLEGVGTLTPPAKKIPFVAIPTTAGTGSEATKNAVISKVGENGFKSSLRHHSYIPDLALIDPELQLSCPRELTACSGMDAFTQLLESLTSTQANPMTDTLALDGIAHIRDSLVRISNDEPHDIALRSKMAYAAWLSGITLANAGLGTVHGFAASIGALYNIPHGVVCGTLMAETNSLTVERILKSDDDHYLLMKFASAGKIFSSWKGRSDSYYSAVLIEHLNEITEMLHIPRLSEFGVKAVDLEKISDSTSNKNNPVKLTKEEMITILTKRL
jgi:alcohol dehydrogenase class IV